MLSTNQLELNTGRGEGKYYTGTDESIFSVSAVYKAGVAVEQPHRAADADQLVTELLQRDAEAKHLLAQLRDGHEMILRMWLLTTEP